MTDGIGDQAAAERLARLQQRRADTNASGSTPGPRSSTGSPAATSKVVAAGASSIAVLSLIALFGQHASSATVEAAPETVETVPTAHTLDAPLSASAPEEAGPAVALLIDDERNATVAMLTPVSEPRRVELAIPAPQTVLLAPPAASTPAAAPAPAATPAPQAAPAPAATSEGS